MRMLVVSTALVAGLVATSALAQPAPPGMPAGAAPMPGARPGNDVGSGMSLPMGTRASNITPQDTHAAIAPNLPTPDLGADAPIEAYLRAAEGALATGRTGEAQQALEMAQTRLLDRSVPLGQTSNPSDNPAVRQISRALQALAAGDRAGCMSAIQVTKATLQASR
jgi:hypothetical protein